MEDITKDFLVEKGFREEYENIFTFSNKEYTIDAIYNENLYPDRHCKIVIFSSSRYMIGNILVKTKEQFNMAMKIYNVDLKTK